MVRAWRPAVPGVTEVFHASMTAYAYPRHCHDVWTVLLVDEGAVRYDLDHHEQQTATTSVNILPPHVVHDGRPVGTGFRKRVLYLDSTWLPDTLIGGAVDHSVLEDRELHRALDGVHRDLEHRDHLAAETGIAFATETVRRLLRAPARSNNDEPSMADRFRQLLDAHAVVGVSLTDAGLALDRNPTHLARSFAAAFGVSPHAYVTARRVDTARRLLLDGMSAADVAVTVGFHDQAHLSRHFRRHTSTTPAAFARSGRLPGQPGRGAASFARAIAAP